MRRWLWTTLLSIGIGACGGGARMLAVSEPPTIRQGESMVVFMRPSAFGGAVSASVFDVSTPETKFVGLVAHGTKVAYPVKPGQHTFMVVSEAADFMQATVTAGRTYYALVTPRVGVWKARFSFRPVRQQELDGAEFAGWNSATQFMANSPEALNWAAQNAADIASKRAQFWPEWASKPEHQRASQTLNADDGKPTQALSSAPASPPSGAARERLAALAPPAAPVAAASVSASPLPQPGDSWTYRFTEHRGARSQKQLKYEVKAAEASAGKVVERYSIDGGAAGERTHASYAYLAGLEGSVFSPYLGAFRDLSARPAIERVEIDDPFCARVSCKVTARVVGQEVVKVPAGSFEAVKVSVDHSWDAWRRDPAGRRELIVWYVLAVKRAVKVSSRSIAGRYRSAAGDFDLELASYQLK